MINYKQMSDTALIEGIKNTQEPTECLTELIARHSGIYMTMVHNYTPSVKSSGPSYKAELIQDKNYYIYQAALKYDDSKQAKFSTYLGNETRWMCLNLWNKNKNKKLKEIGLDVLVKRDPHSEDKEQEILSNQEILDKIMDIAESLGDKRIVKIFKMRYTDSTGNKVTPWKTISQKLNLSIQGCINIHNKALNNIKKELQKDL